MKKVFFVFSLIGNCLIITTILLLTLHVSILVVKKIKKENLYYVLLNDYQKKNYSHLENAEISDLLKNTWYRQYQYSRLTGFSEGPGQSDFVNVNNFGIRSNSKKNFVNYKDLTNAIWFFGGSTTFGYGVEDFNTIPAKLEKILNHKVINFGAGFYYSAQENILLDTYLFTHKPKMVIFLDGLNERCEMEVYEEEFKKIFELAQINYKWRLQEIMAPLFFYAKKLNLSSINDQNFEKNKRKLCSKNGKKFSLVKIVDKNLKDRKQICKKYKVECITFLQPFARIHVSHLDLTSLPETTATRYEEKYNTIKSTFLKYGAIELRKPFENLKEHFFVDNHHYSKEANTILAKSISKILINK